MQAMQWLVQTSVKGLSCPEERLCSLRLPERQRKCMSLLLGCVEHPRIQEPMPPRWGRALASAGCVIYAGNQIN
jgi:hypothetical protein